MGKTHRQVFDAVETLELSKVIHYAGEEVTVLSFREPTGAVLRVIELSQDRGKDGQTLPLLAYFTGIGIPALATLTLRDTIAAIGIVQGLMVDAGLDIGDEDEDEASGPGKS